MHGQIGRVGLKQTDEQKCTVEAGTAIEIDRDVDRSVLSG